MIDAAFDTSSYARRMEQAGFTRMQAEALADEQGRLIEQRLATKSDIGNVRGEIGSVRGEIANVRGEILGVRGDIETLRHHTDASIDRLRQEVTGSVDGLRQETKSLIELLRRDMVIRLGAMIIAGVAVASTLASLLTRLPLRP